MHYYFRAFLFWQKCWSRTFSMTIYLLTFYLFNDIEKNIEITHASSSASSKTILTTNTCNQNVYIFFLSFALGIIHGDRCDRKHQKQLLFSSKTPFFGRWISNTFTFWRNARFDVILTSVAIIKHVSLLKLFCYESLVDIEVSKH